MFFENLEVCMGFEESIVSLLQNEYDLSVKQIISKLRLSNKQENDVQDSILKLISEGRILETDYGRYTLITNTPFRMAKVCNKYNGFCFATLVLEQTDVKLSSNKCLKLMVNDIIYVKLDERKRSNNATLVDVFKYNNYLKANFLVLNDTKSLKLQTLDDFKYSINIINSNFECKPNDLVLVKIEKRDFDYSKGMIVLEVTIKKVLVKASDVGSDITKIIEQFDAPIDFSNEVLNSIKKIPNEVLDFELKQNNRKDYTNTTVVTIDGEDALDFDDAISITKNKNGSYNLTVHIADVSHYVIEDSPLDVDAYERGTSIYVADRVVPMLPTKLSNGICSLNPNVVRLTLSVEMVIDAQGYCIYSEVHRGYIKSTARLTYNEVNNLIESNFTNEVFNKDVTEMLKVAYDCAKAIRRRRENNDCLKIESTEIKFLLDEVGQPTRVVDRVQKDGEKLIEDFMIVTNCEVAKLLSSNNILTVYRIHENPPQDKIELFKGFLRKLNLLKLFPFDITSKNLNKFMDSIEDENIKTLIYKMLLKSMSKAKYSVENVGHFGLNEDFYLHFTSPIRRYPDLTVHRCVKKYLLDKNKYSPTILKDILNKVSIQSSTTERRAQQIEYEVNDLETCKYLSKRLGYTYHANIDGFNNFGMFIKLDIGLDTFLPFAYMKKDTYTFNEKRYEVISKNNTEIYSFGDPIDVCILNVDFDRRKVDVCTKDFLNRAFEVMSQQDVAKFKNNDLSVLEKYDIFETRKTSAKDSKKNKNTRGKSANAHKKETYKQKRSFSKNKQRRKDTKRRKHR